MRVVPVWWGVEGSSRWSAFWCGWGLCRAGRRPPWRALATARAHWPPPAHWLGCVSHVALTSPSPAARTITRQHAFTFIVYSDTASLKTTELRESFCFEKAYLLAHLRSTSDLPLAFHNIRVDYILAIVPQEYPGGK